MSRIAFFMRDGARRADGRGTKRHCGFRHHALSRVLCAAGNPKAIIDRLNTEINAVLALPEVRSKLLEVGANVMPMRIDQFCAFVQPESGKFLQIIKGANLKPE